MPSKQTTISLNCSTNQAFEIALKAISRISDIADYASDSTELAIEARTVPNMKTYGDDIFIEISGSEKKSSIYIMSQTNSQFVDWGRNAENIEHIVAQIHEEAKQTLSQEEKETENVESTSTEKQAKISVEQLTPISNGPSRNLPWKNFAISIIGIILVLSFFGVIDVSKIFSNSNSAIKSTGYDYVLYHLKSPSTAVLVDYFYPDVMKESFKKIGFEMKNNQCAAMYDIEATNGLGGRVRKKYVVFFQDGEPIDLCDAKMITRNAIPTVEYVLKEKGWR